MNEEIEKIFDYYVEEYKIQYFNYRMMGKLIETENVKERIKAFGFSEIYIYGGGYLGVQLYNSVKEFVDVKAIVDKSGVISVAVKGIKSMSLVDLREKYNGEKVIITPVKYYKEIKNDLEKFIDEKNILYLGEFLEGVI